MSKFKELSDAIIRARTVQLDKRTRTNAFAAEFVQQYIHYLGAPPDALRYVPPDEKRPNEAMYNAAAALRETAEGWRLELHLALELPNAVIPIGITFKEDGDRFIVKPDLSGSTHFVRAGNRTDFVELFEAMHNALLASWRGG